MCRFAMGLQRVLNTISVSLALGLVALAAWHTQNPETLHSSALFQVFFWDCALEIEQRAAYNEQLTRHAPRLVRRKGEYHNSMWF